VVQFETPLACSGGCICNCLDFTLIAESPEALVLPQKTKKEKKKQKKKRKRNTVSNMQRIAYYAS
jgi:hypothetical protein